MLGHCATFIVVADFYQTHPSYILLFKVAPALYGKIFFQINSLMSCIYIRGKPAKMFSLYIYIPSNNKRG